MIASPIMKLTIFSPLAGRLAPSRTRQSVKANFSACWKPPGLNAQPWRFIYAFRGEESFDRLVDALWPANQSWAKNAAALVAIASKITLIPQGGQSEVPSPSHGFDAGAAWGYFALQAHIKGWATHAMGGFDPARAAEVMQLPEGYALHAIVAIGMRGEPGSLPEPLRARETPSDRRPLTESAFHQVFQK